LIATDVVLLLSDVSRRAAREASMLDATQHRRRAFPRNIYRAHRYFDVDTNTCRRYFAFRQMPRPSTSCHFIDDYACSAVVLFSC